MTFDGTILVQKALSAIVRAKEQISVGTCIEILRGINSPSVMRHRYYELKTFGVGKEDASVRKWQDYLLQMLQMGFFEIAYNEHKAMKVTPLGWEVLRGNHQVQLVVVQEKKDVTPVVHARRLQVSTSASPAMSDMPEDFGLFERLRQLRKRLAEEQGFPPYIVLSDKVLHDLATVRPKNIEQFGMVHGIGEFKKQKYGEVFLKEINR